jgi:Glycosyl transferase family 2
MSHVGQIEVVDQTRHTPETQGRANAGPSFAFIIEWDNARLSELGRSRRMLKALQEQVIAHRPIPARPPQVVILYDKHEVDPKIIERVIAETIDADAWDSSLKLIPTDGLHYYELKNFGVPHTDREIVIFLDSDTIPESGWLDALMSAIERPEIDVVGGNTYVSPSSFIAKAFALFWFYGLRAEGRGLYSHDFFYANNVAFKRAVLERYPYPNLDSFRGQCHMLSEQLRRDGVKIFRQDSARMGHPPPNGFKHFYRRAICEGHDEMAINRERNAGTKWASPVGSAIRLREGLKSSLNRIVKHRRDVGLSVAGAGAAAALGAIYCFLKYFGEVVTYVSPKFVRRHWPI